MRVLFIYRMVYQDPLGVLYLASALKRAGHDVHYIDAVLDKNWEENAIRLAPDIIGYSVLTGNQRFYLDINSRLKSQIHFFSVWGGPHPTFFPELINEDGVDAVCIGEGEEAIVDLADALERDESIESIPNLHVKTDKGVVRNEPRRLCVNLDELPFPDRSIMLHYPQYRCSTSRGVIASRGCPHSCAFCYNSRLRRLYKGKGKYTRLRSVENIVEECVRHREDPWTTQIFFRDDLFAYNEEFVHDFANLYEKEVGLPFLCNARADRMTERMARDLARAGARIIHFGVESGSDRIRYEVLRRRISRRDMINATRWLKENGIRTYTFNIVGIPGETLEEARETLEFNAMLQPDMAVFSVYQPYPKTLLGDNAISMGLTDPGGDPFSPTYFGVSMKRMPHVRRYRNMVALFPAAVQSKLMRWMLPILLPLPVTPAYDALNFVYKATQFVFSLGITPPRDVALYSGRWLPPGPPERRA